MQDYELQWLRQDMIEEIYHVLTVSDETNMNMVIDSLNERDAKAILKLFVLKGAK